MKRMKRVRPALKSRFKQALFLRWMNAIQSAKLSPAGWLGLRTIIDRLSTNHLADSDVYRVVQQYSTPEERIFALTGISKEGDDNEKVVL